MNKPRNIKEIRGYWADTRRGAYILEREIERSYKKDPEGAEMLRKLVAEPLRKLLDSIDEPITQGDEVDFALSLAGLNNYNLRTFKRKIEVFMPHYIKLMALEGIEVTLVEKRRVIATRVS